MLSDEGIGVIDTTSLRAAAVYLEGSNSEDLEDSHYYRQITHRIAQTNCDYFLSLMHNIMLYDELRTDFTVLDGGSDVYRDSVKFMINALSNKVRVGPITFEISDEEIAESIVPFFLNNAELFKSMGEFYAIDSLGYMVEEARSERATPFYINLIADAIMDVMKRKGINAGVNDIAGILSVVSRTLRYSAHSQYLQKIEGTPSAFCASPKRIDLMRGFVDSKYLADACRGSSDYLDLFSKLGLPTRGMIFQLLLPNHSRSATLDNISSVSPQKMLLQSFPSYAFPTPGGHSEGFGQSGYGAREAMQ